MFHLTSPFLAALLYSSATVQRVDAQAVDCTETFGDLIYPPLEVECPPVGGRIVVSFKWKMPGEEGGGNVGVQRTIAATHGRNLTSEEDPGIVIGPEDYEGDCNGFSIADEPDDVFFQGEYEEYCATGLSENSLCVGVSVNGDEATIRNDGVVVFNTGGCVDKVKLEVSLSGIFGGPGECVEPLEVVCDSSPATDAPASTPVDSPITSSNPQPTLPVADSEAHTFAFYAVVSFVVAMTTASIYSS